MDKNLILTELIQNQRKDVQFNEKLNLDDFKRIVNFLNKSIFDNECSLWTGAISDPKKGNYISFYFNKKKIALHRLLYVNFIGEINSNEYIKFSCSNKGSCCNIHHIKKSHSETEPRAEIKHEIKQEISDKNKENINEKLIVRF